MLAPRAAVPSLQDPGIGSAPLSLIPAIRSDPGTAAPPIFRLFLTVTEFGVRPPGPYEGGESGGSSPVQYPWDTHGTRSDDASTIPGWGRRNGRTQDQRLGLAAEELDADPVGHRDGATLRRDRR